MSVARTIFYSWQSDSPNSTNRGFIEDALKRAISNLKRDEAIITPDRGEIRLDKDIAGVPGSPDIAAAILDKIDACAMFVADVTTVGAAGPNERPMQNPNVLFELGYAWRAVTPGRVLLVCNTAYSTDPDRPELDLPFDLRKHSFVRYALHEGEDKIDARAYLVKRFEGALKEIMATLVPRLPQRSPLVWQPYVSLRGGTFTCQHEFALDTDGDGQEEPLVLVGIEAADGASSLRVLPFRYYGGGWKLLSVEPITTPGQVFIASAEARFLTDETRRDLVVGWNCGGSGSWQMILRDAIFSYQPVARSIDGLTAPLGIAPLGWPTHYRQQITYRPRDDSAMEDIVERLGFDDDDARQLPGLYIPPDRLNTGWIWVERVWRWDRTIDTFVLIEQRLTDAPTS